MPATLTRPVPVLPRLARLPMRLLSGLGQAFLALAELGPRMDQIRKLNATSDEALFRRGLTRDEAVRRIFADRIWL